MDLEQFKAECNRAIELGEKASPPPWGVWGMDVMNNPSDPGNANGAELICPTYCTNGEGRFRTFDADHIAHARTFSPAAARALLVSLSGYEQLAASVVPEAAAIGQKCLSAILAAFTPKD